MTQALTIIRLPGECWYGGTITEGYRMPYMPGYQGDTSQHGGNQSAPVLLSTQGRVIWCEGPFTFQVTTNQLRVQAIDPDDKIELSVGGSTLAHAYRRASADHFPFGNGMPDPLLFSAPQYNLWIELLYRPTQAKVLAYADAVLANGFPPGVLMIDTLWSPTYTPWRFDAGRFPDPKAMAEALHARGFKLMVWVAPFVTADTLTFRKLREQGCLITGADGKPVIAQWWDGYSATLDLLNPATVTWLHEHLDWLVHEIGVDGFKFDGGDPDFYAPLGVSDPLAYCTAWNKIGLRYSMSEFRAAWKVGGLPLMQRIRDRHHTWDEQHGLQSLIPLAIAQGLDGYPFNCPDMIAGGDYGAFPPSPENQEFLLAEFAVPPLDAELFVRSAQCAALFPMMQFSAAPWRVLDAEHAAYCRAAAQLHAQLGPEIRALAEQAAQTGEPILRSLEYVFPGRGYEAVRDQFLLGDAILVAPVLVKGARSRLVRFPPGDWQDENGDVLHGPIQLEVAAPLNRLPWYRTVGVGK